MHPIYFDNAATTPMLPEVVSVIQESMLTNFGNPSSIHQFGRKAKVAVESARKNIAKKFNISPSELVFTSSGTDADNWVLNNAVKNLGVKRIITSKIEHYAVLRVVEKLQVECGVEICYVKLDEYGRIDVDDLEILLSKGTLKTIVSLMMVNNEIGNLLPIKKVSQLCKLYNSLFHSDTVQAIGHYNIDLKEIPIDFIVGSGHKFHGPKGVGFVCFKKENPLMANVFGGGQEKGLRAGTENVHAIVGMEKALSLSYKNLEKDNLYVLDLKKYFIQSLKGMIKGVCFNGLCCDVEESSVAIVNVRFPVSDAMLLFNFDLAGVAVSSGSACNSGAQKKSHVLNQILTESDSSKNSIRFSFSKLNTFEELDAFFVSVNKMF